MSHDFAVGALPTSPLRTFDHASSSGALRAGANEASLTPDQNLRKRVAHHEAGHAVVAVAERFVLINTFLCSGATSDGTIGGCTEWYPKQVGAVTASSADEAVVLYAGQYAERHLAAVDGSVRVPAHDDNWNDDDSRVARALATTLQTNPHVDAIVRQRAAATVTTYWRAIASVARDLCAAHPDPASQRVTGICSAYVPASRVVDFTEVLRYIGEDRVAAEAHRRFQSRGSRHGMDFDDWLNAEREVGAQHPEVVERWILDDNLPAASFVASFQYDSPSDASTAQATFSNFSLNACASADVLRVSFDLPAQAGLVVQLAKPGGRYIRRRCLVQLA